MVWCAVVSKLLRVSRGLQNRDEFCRYSGNAKLKEEDANLYVNVC